MKEPDQGGGGVVVVVVGLISLPMFPWQEPLAWQPPLHLDWGWQGGMPISQVGQPSAQSCDCKSSILLPGLLPKIGLGFCHHLSGEATGFLPAVARAHLSSQVLYSSWPPGWGGTRVGHWLDLQGLCAFPLVEPE